MFVGRPSAQGRFVVTVRYRWTAITHQMASTTPNGQAPDKKP